MYLFIRGYKIEQGILDSIYRDIYGNIIFCSYIDIKCNTNRKSSPLERAFRIEALGRLFLNTDDRLLNYNKRPDTRL